MNADTVWRQISIDPVQLMQSVSESQGEDKIPGFVAAPTPPAESLVPFKLSPRCVD